MKGHAFLRGGCVCLLLALAGGMAGAQEKKDDEIAALKRLLQEQADVVKQLTSRVEKLEKEKGVTPPPARPGEEPEIPPLVIPSEKTQPPTTAPATGQPSGTTRASLTPDIAVFGINQGRFLSVRGDPDRNRLQLGEFEVALEQPVYTGIGFKATLTGGAEENFNISAEEAYASFSRVGHLPFGGLLGKKRLNFGKINPIHSHARAYVDQPAPLANFLGGEALFGNGASLNYQFPFKNLFANLEVGFWKTNAAAEGIDLGTPDAPNFYPAGLGITGDFPTARLWLSKEFGMGSELEFGASHGFGRAPNGDRINLTGLDLTYRAFPGPFQRLMLQGEVFWHHRHDVAGGTGGHTRSGHTVFLSYRPDQYYEYGLRYDNSRFPWPLPGREQSVSLIWSNRLTESTVLRFQYKYGDRLSDVFLPGKRGFSEFYLQFIWGAGTHKHPLQ